MTKRTVPPDAYRFLREARVAFGYQALLAELTARREEAVRLAIYTQDREARTLSAGRAQAWTEVIALFTDAQS